MNTQYVVVLQDLIKDNETKRNHIDSLLERNLMTESTHNEMMINYNSKITAYKQALRLYESMN